jgi:hypothetical protein
MAEKKSPEPKVDPNESKEVMAPAQVFVTKQYKLDGKEGEPQAKEEIISIQKFVTEPARVSFALGLTLNLGNYESARIDVGMYVPCYREEAQDAYLFAKKFVMDRLVKEKDAIKDKKDTDIV